MRMRELPPHVKRQLIAWTERQARTRPYWAKRTGIHHDLRNDRELRGLMEARFRYLYPDLSKEQAKRWSVSFLDYARIEHKREVEEWIRQIHETKISGLLRDRG